MKKLFAMLGAVMVAGVTMAQLPIVTPESISRVGTAEAVAVAYLTIYNTGGTADVSNVTIVSDDTNVVTVGTASSTISNNYLKVTLTFATGLDEGNYTANVTVTQTNAPATVRTVPISVRITKDASAKLGSLADARIVPFTVDGDADVEDELPVPRYYGDMIVGKVGLTDLSGTEYTRMNLWVSEGTDGDDWKSLAGEVYTAVQLVGPQRDTNAATTVTGYTPRYFGDMLVGRLAAATGALWVAVGTTTNDWKAIGP